MSAKPKNWQITATVNGAQITIFYITDDASALDALAELKHERVVGYDVETTPKEKFKLDPQGGLDPYRSKLRLIQFGKEDGTIYIIDNFFINDATRTAICQFLEEPLPIKCGHNLKFDIKFARAKLGVKKFGGLFCTELATRIVKCGTSFGRISLVNAVKEMLDISVEKEFQRSDWSKIRLSKDQLVYAAYDAYVVLLLRQKLIAWMRELELVECAKLEFDALDPVCWMELSGLGFNPDGWLAATEKTKQKRVDTSEKIAQMLEPVIPQKVLFENAPCGVNLGSQKQMVWVLNEFGIDLPEMSEPRGKGRSKKKVKKKIVEQGDLFSYDGFNIENAPHSERWKNPEDSEFAPVGARETKAREKIKQTTRNWQIKPLKQRWEIIALLLDWREYQKRVTSYGEKYLRYINPITNRIHSDYDPLRAKTGRYGNSKPNLQQIPRDDDYRSCFIPTVGYKFVGADYSQIELRIAAERHLEWKLINAFKAGIDPHDNTTHEMFHLDFPPKKGTPEYEAWKETPAHSEWITFRVFAKNINFGIPYGMGAWTLATRTGLTPDEATAHLETYSNTYVDLVKGLERDARTVRNTGQLRTLSGRIAKFVFNPEDKEDVARAERNGKNTPIQGGNADIMKRALRLFVDAIFENGWEDVMHPVHIVHDEIIAEAKFGFENKCAKILKKAMIDAGEEYLKIVPVEVEPTISDEWKKD